MARPQGRGKIERLFRTINTELLSELRGNLRNGKPASPPRLSLPELDEAIGAFIVSTYNARAHVRSTRHPSMPGVARGGCRGCPTVWKRWMPCRHGRQAPGTFTADGNHFERLRFFDPTLAAYVGQPVTIRFDPRDVG